LSISEDFFAKAVVLCERNENEAAAEVLEQAVRMNPDHAKALHLLGHTYDRLHKPGKARICIEKALRIDPSLSMYSTGVR